MSKQQSLLFHAVAGFYLYLLIMMQLGWAIPFTITSRLPSKSSFLLTSAKRPSHFNVLRRQAPTPLNLAHDTVNGESSPQKDSNLQFFGLVGWVVSVGTFIIVNYGASRTSPWPVSLLRFGLPVWNLVHAVCGMLFAGTILTTTVLEWMVVQSCIPSVLGFWFRRVERLQSVVVLPALTGSIISGVAQSYLTYECGLKLAPRHVKSTLHVLTLFGIWWAVTDITTQGKARKALSRQQGHDAVNNSTGNTSIPLVLYRRRWSNVISCFFLLVLYTIMVLKPGYTGNAIMTDL